MQHSKYSGSEQTVEWSQDSTALEVEDSES